MKKKLIILFGIAALTLVPAVSPAAQPVAGPDDEESEPMLGEPRGPGGPARPELMLKERGLPAVEEDVLSVIKEHDPAFAAKLADLKTAAGPKYKMILLMARRALNMARMEKDESLTRDAVQSVSLEYGIKELSIRYDKAADPEKAGIRAELKVKVSELFDLRLKGQEFRVKRMEKDLAKLKKNIETRKAGKAKIVEERVGQLTGESVGW